MKNWPLVMLSALLVAALLLHSWPTPESASAQDKKAPADGLKWDYKVIAVTAERDAKALNQLGEEGWELGATIISAVSGGEQQRFAGQDLPKWSFNAQTQLILKRPKR